MKVIVANFCPLHDGLIVVWDLGGEVELLRMIETLIRVIHVYVTVQLYVGL